MKVCDHGMIIALDVVVTYSSGGDSARDQFGLLSARNNGRRRQLKPPLTRGLLWYCPRTVGRCLEQRAELNLRTKGRQGTLVARAESNARVSETRPPTRQYMIGADGEQRVTEW